mmetsp:Transcript_178488/g.566341  ORF Transcript_178488/g.566341 Transcript_178488/m.566341 type:complete len:326 (-) Transcript_178488:212-1189(-)
MTRSTVQRWPALLLPPLLLMLAAGPVMAAETVDRGAFSLLYRAVFGNRDDSAAAERPPTPMRVIGAGLGRTGTSSLNAALKQLGHKPYHMAEGVVDQGHEAQWRRVVEASLTGNTSEFKAATDAVIDLIAAEGFDATTDYPACLIFEELLRRYPDAKVILSTRSSGKSWAKSVLSSIGHTHNVIKHRPFSFLKKLRDAAVMTRGMYPMTGIKLDKDDVPEEKSLIASFDTWAAHVRKVVPPDKLLVHIATDGFVPLCVFLGVPHSDCPDEYPNVNDSAMIRRAILLFEVITWIWFPAAVAVVLLIAYALVCCFGRSTPNKAGKSQ